MLRAIVPFCWAKAPKAQAPAESTDGFFGQRSSSVTRKDKVDQMILISIDIFFEYVIVYSSRFRSGGTSSG